jgi:hypothetical protein
MMVNRVPYWHARDMATDSACYFAEVQTAYLAVPGPKTYEEAEASDEAEEWKGAIASEQASLRQHDVYEFVEKAPGKVVESKWVMVIKQLPDGTIEKYKARLVVRGDMQTSAEYSEISSPVVDAEVIRLTLAEAARKDLDIAVLDVPTAYLGATLQEEVHIRLPAAVWKDDPWGRKRPLVRLKKSVPGLKQSGKCWFDDISAFIEQELGLKASIAAPGLFHGAESALLNLYVDDLMIVAKGEKLRELCDKLKARFDTKGGPVGDRFMYVGLAITRDRHEKSIHITQQAYIKKIIERFGMAKSTRRILPMESGMKLHARRDDEQAYDRDHYRQAIGCLLYAALGSRPDISYAVGVLGRFAADPSTLHWQAVKHLLRYLVGTAHYSLPIVPDEDTRLQFLEKFENADVVAYADSDHAGDADTAKSTSGWFLLYKGCPIMWRSRKQSLVAQGTMEAELIATAEAWRHVLWLSDVLFELSITGTRPTVTMVGDNESCLTVVDSGFPNASRHLRLRFHLLQEAMKAGQMELVQVPSDDQLADGLTKALGRVKHAAFLEALGMH